MSEYTIKLPALRDGECWRALESFTELHGEGFAFKDWPSDMIAVGDKSRMDQRRAVEACARFFRREFRYDFVQYSAAVELGTHDRNTVAFLWLMSDGGLDLGNRAYGACCFRWREWKNWPRTWALQWIWLHPFMRGEGTLSAAWPTFGRIFAPFWVEPPLSHAMTGFLAKKPHTLRLSTDGHELKVYGLESRPAPSEPPE